MKHRLAITADGNGIEATAFNPDYPRVPYRVVIERRAPGNLIEANIPEGSKVFRYLIKVAREQVAQ